MHNTNKYRVCLYLYGTIDRHVLADSKESAIQKVMDLMIEKDGVTPKTSVINAFDWDFPTNHVHPANDKVYDAQADLNED
jgi:hypothetical protein